MGSHTYSASGDKQLYHENVQILNNTVTNTYNAAIRILNWKNCVIKGNTFTNTQGLSDGRKIDNGDAILYAAVFVKGAVNPTLTQNKFNKVKFFPIVVDVKTEANTPGAIKAGYPDTLCNLSEKNYADMADNTFQNIEENYRYILTRDTEMQPTTDAEQREIKVKNN